MTCQDLWRLSILQNLDTDMKVTIKFRFLRKSESGNTYCTLLGFAINDERDTFILYLLGIMIGLGFGFKK